MSRIIAGSAKGRTFEAPKGAETRPTADRVREALFSFLGSWLGTLDEAPAQQLADIFFLDFYSGSGGVGLEAASRGADVVAVEKNSAAAGLIRRNAASLALEVEVRAEDAARVAEQPGRDFDVVFADPPYDVDSADLDALVATLQRSGGVASRGLIVLERSSRSPAPTWGDGIEESWDKRYGETVLYFAVTKDENP